MRSARIEIENVWQRVTVELAQYALEISSVPPPALDCKSFALIPRIAFAGVSQEPLIRSETEACDLWRSQFEMPESERPNWMPPLPIVSFSDFPAASCVRPLLEEFLPSSGSKSPPFHLIETPEEQEGRELLSPPVGQEQEGSKKQTESGAFDETGSLDAEIYIESFPHYCLNVACRFDEIKGNARARSGSGFGISRSNAREYIVGAMLDLRTALECFWPNLPNDAVACFWGSWQAQNYLACFCGQMESSLRSAQEAVTSTKVPGQQEAQTPRGKLGRPKALVNVDPQRVKQIRGDLTQPQFAQPWRRKGGISLDVLQLAENQGLATLATIRKINERAKALGRPVSLQKTGR